MPRQFAVGANSAPDVELENCPTERGYTNVEDVIAREMKYIA